MQGMPVSYKIDKESRLVTSTAWGVITRQEIIDHRRKLAADPDFSPTYSTIADFTRVTKLEITAADVQAFAAKNVFAPSARRAIIVADSEAFGLARMFEILRDAKGEEGIRIFRKIEHAREWLQSPQQT
jgi:hypothetical protein